jgi:hypothetical protein
VWGNWLPQEALRGLFAKATANLDGRASPWSMVRGPISASVATAQRLGWRFVSPTIVVDDLERRVDLTLDPPSLVRQQVRAAV